jgi:hypothetical protein
MPFIEVLDGSRTTKMCREVPSPFAQLHEKLGGERKRIGLAPSRREGGGASVCEHFCIARRRHVIIVEIALQLPEEMREVGAA